MKLLARRERKSSAFCPVGRFKHLVSSGCIVVLTGPVDYISDGTTVVSLSNGNELLGKITGSGCILGSIIASYCATATSGTLPTEETKLVDLDALFLGALTGYVRLLGIPDDSVCKN